MLDRDLAELYEVETSQLKRSVKKNVERFPKDFMFDLTKSASRLKKSEGPLANPCRKLCRLNFH